MNWYKYLPLKIDPIVFSIGNFDVRWYSISYIIGFAIVYALLAWRIKKGEFPRQRSNTLADFFLVTVFATLIGGRMGYVIFYGLNYFSSNPLAVISPYDKSGELAGIFGMSFHGALVGALVGSYLFCKLKKINFLEWSDFIVPAVPAGYFFGRLGNFFNSELLGRVTNSPLGMYFPTQPNVLRFPSQLLEALLEGALLFLFLWSMRNSKKIKGKFLIIYVVGYSCVRIFSEFFRDPDPQLGLFFGILTMGQMLSLATIGGCLVLAFKKSKKYVIFQ